MINKNTKKYKLVPCESLKNQWVLVLEFMHGDGDVYTKEEVRFDNEEEFIKAASSVLDRLKFEQENRYVANSSYSDWCDNQIEWIYIPWDSTSGYNYKAAIDNFYAFFYDKNGQKFNVVFE